MLVCDECIMYKLLIDHVPLASVFSKVSDTDSLYPEKINTKVKKYTRKSQCTNILTAAAARHLKSDLEECSFESRDRPIIRSDIKHFSDFQSFFLYNCR